MKKRFRSFAAVLLSVIMMMGVILVAPLTVSAASKTADDAISWCQSKLGQGVEYSIDEYRYQCVDFIQAYYSYLGVSPSWGSGYQYAENTLPAGWTRTYGGKPQKGDILVYTGGYGHVAIYESDYVSYHQNWSGSYVQRVERYYGNSVWVSAEGVTKTYWGCIHPNFTSFVPTEDLSLKASVYFNSHKYEYYDSKMTWKNAKEVCEKKGGHLAYINSSEENIKVTNLVNGSTVYVWLGSSDEGHEGSWYWNNGDELSYHNWYIGEPNNADGVEHFLQLIAVGDATGKWNDAANDSSKVGGFICEYEPQNTIEYEDHKYEFFNMKTTWKEAKEECENRGGHLAFINSSDENAVVTDLVNSSIEYVWLGGSDEGHEGSWYWTNGDELSYHNWYTGEPNNADGVEHFLQLIVIGGARGKWNDAANDSSRVGGFICEYGSYKTIEYNRHKYELFNGKTTWKYAKEECERRGGHLAVINSAEENETLSNLASIFSYYVWIGGSDEGSEGNWHWINGEDFAYTNWNSGEPNNSAEGGGSEDFVGLLGKSGKWNDAVNDYKYINGYICEYEPSTYYIGDTNLDGYITINDVTAIQRHLAEIESLTEVQLDLADTNGDGEINIADATHLQLFLAEYDGIVLGKS